MLFVQRSDTLIAGAFADSNARPIEIETRSLLMLQFIRKLFAEEIEGGRACVPAGDRVYAIGDIHGRSDLFAALIDAIEADDQASGEANSTVILLGDLIDRGPDSAGVLRLARSWQQQRSVRILVGNHEEMLLKSLNSLDTLRHFLRHGGRQTAISYGASRAAFADTTVEEAQQILRDTIPREDLDYIEGFEDMIRIGDYVFVHAGIDPEVPLETQSRKDLRWIREPFLSHSEPLEGVVVHGHTICEVPEDTGIRIGIDTGAYVTGRLTALVLEGSRRRYIEAVENEDRTITAGPREVNA